MDFIFLITNHFSHTVQHIELYVLPKLEGRDIFIKVSAYFKLNGKK